MRINIKKWGNSAAVRIPQTLLEHFDLKEGDTLDVDISNGAITLRPIRRRKYSLKELMAEMPEDFPRLSDWENIVPVGKEKI